MKSWTTRVGLVLTMLAMVLAVSIPAVALNRDDCRNFKGDLFCEVEDGNHHGDFFDEDSDDEDCEDFEFGDFDEEECGFGFDEDEIALDFEDGQFYCGDNDGDGLVDEDSDDDIDNDLDGLFDEDENLSECDDLFFVAEVDA
jgi:hypothetical protein